MLHIWHFVFYVNFQKQKFDQRASTLHTAREMFDFRNLGMALLVFSSLAS